MVGSERSAEICLSSVSMDPMNQVVSVGDFSSVRKSLPVKSAVATSLVGMTLRIVQNNTTLTTPPRRKIESLVDKMGVSETNTRKKIPTLCLPEHRDGERNGVAGPFTKPQDGDGEKEDGIRDLDSKRWVSLCREG